MYQLVEKTIDFKMISFFGGIYTTKKNICNIIRNNVHLNAIVIMLFYLFCSGLFPFSVATEPQLSFVKRPMDTGYALGSSTQMASKNTFNKNNPIVIEANKAVAEALGLNEKKKKEEEPIEIEEEVDLESLETGK